MNDKALTIKLKQDLGNDFYNDDLVINEALVVLSTLLDNIKDGKDIFVIDDTGKRESLNIQSLRIMKEKIKGA